MTAKTRGGDEPRAAAARRRPAPQGVEPLRPARAAPAGWDRARSLRRAPPPPPSDVRSRSPPSRLPAGGRRGGASRAARTSRSPQRRRGWRSATAGQVEAAGGSRGRRRGLRRENSIAQRVRREEIGIDVERRGDFGKRARPLASLDGSTCVGQPCLKSLPGRPGIHVRSSCKMSSRLGSWTSWVRTLAASGYESVFCAIRAHVSRSDTVRLKTSAPGRESMSTQK